MIPILHHFCPKSFYEPIITLILELDKGKKICKPLSLITSDAKTKQNLPQQNIRKLYLTMYKLNYIPLRSGIYPDRQDWLHIEKK